MEDSFNPYSFVHVWFNPLWIRNIPVRNCANHMLLLMFNIHCGPNMCIAHSGFNDYGMIMYHLLVLVVPSLFEIITWNKPIALEALERCGHSYGHMLQPCFPHSFLASPSPSVFLPTGVLDNFCPVSARESFVAPLAEDRVGDRLLRPLTLLTELTH